MEQTNHKKLYIGSILTIMAAVLLDQLTKYLAVSGLKGKESIVLIKGVFELQYLENRGAAFGLLQDQKWFFIVTGILMLGLAFFIFTRLPFTRRLLPVRICCIFIAAGAIGNMIDRIWHRYVIDFFYFSLIDFPIFNVADIYLTVTTVLLLLLILFYYKEEELDTLFAVFSRKNRKESTHE